MIERRLAPALCWILGHEPCVARRYEYDTYECPCGRLEVTAVWIAQLHHRPWRKIVRRVARPL